RRCAPEHELARIERGTSEPGQRLDDLDRIALGPRSLARLGARHRYLARASLAAYSRHDDFLGRGGTLGASGAAREEERKERTRNAELWNADTPSHGTSSSSASKPAPRSCGKRVSASSESPTDPAPVWPSNVASTVQ